MITKGNLLRLVISLTALSATVTCCL